MAYNKINKKLNELHHFGNIPLPYNFHKVTKNKNKI